MTDSNFEAILARIARENHTTVAEVRCEMQAAMEAGLTSPNPLVQAKWAAIPRKGDKLTLEEFVAYIASYLS